jgi:hypothetical protein
VVQLDAKEAAMISVEIFQKVFTLFNSSSDTFKMEFLFRDRGQGKRQVKVSQDIALLEDQFAAESSDDSEFK